MPRPSSRLAAALSAIILVGQFAAPSALARGAPQRTEEAVCSVICGNWEQARPDEVTAATILDESLARYREPDYARYSDASSRCAPEVCTTPGPDPEDDFLNPKAARQNWRPTRAEMREELLPKTQLPASMVMAWQDGGLAIQADGVGSRYAPGEAFSRVDAWGAAEIDSRWQNGRFVVREDYGRGRRNVDVYRYDPKRQLLFLERKLDRPGVPTVVLVRTYVRRLASGVVD